MKKQLKNKSRVNAYVNEIEERFLIVVESNKKQDTCKKFMQKKGYISE